MGFDANEKNFSNFSMVRAFMSVLNGIAIAGWSRRSPIEATPHMYISQTFSPIRSSQILSIAGRLKILK